MKLDLSKRELELIERAIVQTGEFWTQPKGGGCGLKNRTARKVMEKICEAYERSQRGKAKARDQAWKRR